MDMLFAMRVLNGIGLKVQLPMILEVDNKAAVDLCNNWSIGGRTRHVEVKQFFLRELKERGLIHVKWTSGEKMTSDIFTKNLAGPLFDKHAQSFVGRDKYMVAHGDVEWTESVSIPKGRVSDYSGLGTLYNARIIRDRKINSHVGMGARKSVRTIGKSTIKSEPTDSAVRLSGAGLKNNDPHHKIFKPKREATIKGKGCMVGNRRFLDNTKRRREVLVEKNNFVDMTNEWEPCMFGTEGYEKTVIDMDYCRVWAPILV